MACGVRRLVVCLACCGVGLLSSAAGAFGEGSLSAGESGSSESFGSALAVSGVQVLDGGQQARAVEEAKRSAPEAVAGREASRTRYEGLDTAQAARVAGEAFPGAIHHSLGGPPSLSAGQKIVGYPAVNVARVDRGGGKRGAIESVEPMAIKTSAGMTPIDLSLKDSNGAFEPSTPLFGLRVPKQLSNGVGLGGTGVSLTPVNERGSPLGGSEGSVDGAAVLYANTQTDADTLVKPTTSGFEMSTVLRSVNSPQQLDYKVGLPSGASMVQDPKDAGSVRVVDEGITIALIDAPSAQDAEGTQVPVSMRVSGDLLVVSVASFAAGQYRLPIVVDPTTYDMIWQDEWYYSTYYRTEWHFEHYGAGFGAPEHPEGGSWTEDISGGHNSGESGGLFYTTRGASQITRAKVEGRWNDSGSHIANYVVLDTPTAPYTEDYDAMPEATESWGWGGYACAPALSCPETTAGSAPPENHNTAGYEQEAYGPGEGHAGENTVTQAYVQISQEQGPELDFNKTSSTIYNKATGENVPNVLYGSGSWLGPHSGAFEVRAKDPGLGLSLYRVLASGWGDEKFYYALGECIGIQCPEYNDQGYTYKTGMPDGEASFEALAEDPVGLYADIYPQKIKVDATPPHNIKITGLQNGNELAHGESHIEVEASDGTGSTPSSGVKSVKVGVDGYEVPGSAASCSPGPCTASTEFTLAARDYTSGQHSLVVTATDNANNVAQEEFTFRVHGASPVSVGPGSVDPSNGQLTLNASDVSLGGTSGVSRTYQSRNLTAGAEGPLGPQWAINLGGGEGLTVLADGSAVLTASGGASTAFTLNEKGEFESPKGDSNLKLEAKEKEPGEGISEYILTDATAGTKTKFEQPTGTQSATPTFVNGFGAEAGQLTHPISDAIDSSGDLWVTSSQSDLLEKFSPTGILLGTYGSEGTAEGQFIGPWGVAIDPRNGNLYVSDQGNNRVEEISPSGSFIKMFGWGVSNGNAEFEICTKECKPGIAGAGNGQFDVMAGVSTDSSGNVWVADYGNNRIQEFNEKGEYVQRFGSIGKGAGEFEGPTDIAFSGGNVYVTDSRNNRVQEFSTAGAHVGGFGEGGSENSKFSGPYGIASDPRNGNIYVVDSGNSRVQEFTSAGSFITKFGSAGTGPGEFTTPQGIAVNPSGSVYIVDNGANVLDEWMRSVWVPAEVGGPLAASTTTYSYTTVEEEGKAVVQPSEALAPIPAGVSSCTPLVRGCRALTFNYASSTTATGENESEWGDYAGHLTRVYFHAWDPSTGAMSEPVVAQYAYDKQGRLRAEWDPRISPALKTIYGYDTEEHVTALTQAGQESWAFTYGTTAGDPDTGRLLKVTRAPASAGLWGGELPYNTEAPKLSGVPAVGMRMSVSNGAWSNSPVAYAYQWEDCNPSGKECTPILGSTNENYTPASSDVGHTLVADVIATNGGGSVTAPSTASEGVGAVEEGYALPSKSYPEEIAAGPDGDLWFTDEMTSKIGKITTSGVITEYTLPPGSSPWGITAGPDGDLWFTEDWASKIGKVTTSGVITEYSLPSGSNPRGITAGPDGDLWFTNGWRKIGKITTSGVITEYSLPSESLPEGITAGPDGDLWFTDYSTGKIGKITTSGVITEYSLPSGSNPRGITAGPDGDLWFTDSGTSRIEKITTSGEEGENHAPQPGTTIEYNVPVSGTGAPYAMSSSEVAKWGQTDDTTEAMAILPPDEPQGWPASGYKRATIHYLDAEGRAVNTVVPSGGISTSEYNETNEVVRTLSADNRAAALKESGNTAEAAEKLDTKSTYSEEGTELLGTLGPEHTVKLASGSEVQARDHVKYSYDEGAPEGKGYELVTKATDGAQYAGKEEDVRTTTTSYSGQENLGWKLRKATSVTTEPEAGKPSTRTTVYSPETGDVLETKPPAGSQEHSGELTYSSQFGSEGSGNGQFGLPGAVAVDSHGDLWVVDHANQRIEKFNDKGEYIRQFGGEGSGAGEFSNPDGVAVGPNGNVWVADTDNSRIEEFNEEGEFVKSVGTEGSGNGEFVDPEGIAVDAHNDVWVSDTYNDRIEEFNENGEYMRTVGEADGEPEGLTVVGGHVWVADWVQNRVQEYSESGTLIRQFGSGGEETYGVAVDPDGEVLVADISNNDVQVFSEGGEHITQFGSTGSGSGQFEVGYPMGLAADSKGNVWVTDRGGHRVEKWTSSPISSNPAAHDTQIIYYSAGANSSYPACGEHPEWANLPCQTQPGEQPEDEPSLPVSSVTYNVWDEVEATTEKFGSTTRTKTQTYDGAGRALTSEATSTVDTPLPKVTNEYSAETGALVKQSTTTAGETKTITSAFNTLGQLESYTDADGNTSTYKYDIDGRVEEVSDGKGSQIYAYDATTGFLTKLLDSAAGMFTASYDVEGKMLSEGYPNGMTASYALSPLGQATGLEYVKTTHCSESCTLFSDSVVPSIHGETLAQTSTLAKDSYVYDNAGRLTQTQEEPAGKGCTTRVYAYDEESNRTSLTTREPGSEGKCAGEGGATESHTYDAANRLTDAGVAYETFGNTTKLPAADAGGHELTSSYYVDSQVASQTQNEETIDYSYDPAGRARETVSTGKTSATVISHYSGPGEAPTWTGEGGEQWTRNIPGIDGSLAAIQSSSGTTVLQLRDLQGNIVATAALSETETKLLSTYNSTEFGVPQPGTTPPKYAWLGAGGVSSEPGLSSGVATNGGASYVPEIGRSLQTGPIASPGSFPDGTGGAGVVQATYLQAAAGQLKVISIENAASREAAAAAEAAEHARLAECPASECHVDGPGEGNCELGQCEAGEEPEVIDPAIFLTSRQAEVAATASRNGPGALETLAKSGLIRGFTAFLAERLAEIGKELLQGVAYGLEICYTSIHASSGTEARCRLYVDWITNPISEGPNIVDYGVETCWGKSYKRANSVHWTFPYCHPA